MTRRRWALVGALLVVVVVAAGGWLWRHEQAANAHDAECAANRANAQASRGVVGPAGGEAAVILGDSWGSGWTLPRPGDAFPSALARSEGWRAEVDAFPGSGYVAGSPCGGQAFAARVGAIPAGTRVVLIEGGINDALGGVSAADEQAAAAAVLAQVAARAPGARVVMVGPPVLPILHRAAADRIDGALRAAATVGGARYVSALDWPIRTGPDGLHPTVAGHRMFAADLAAALVS